MPVAQVLTSRDRVSGLEPDIVTMGKPIVADIPLDANGTKPEVAEMLQRPLGRDDPIRTVATVGTVYGNPLCLAAARAAMREVLTASAYSRA